MYLPTQSTVEAAGICEVEPVDVPESERTTTITQNPTVAK